jgi:hypothetical protein
MGGGVHAQPSTPPGPVSVHARTIGRLFEPA